MLARFSGKNYPGISYGCLSLCLRKKMLLFGVWACFFCGPPSLSLGALCLALPAVSPDAVLEAVSRRIARGESVRFVAAFGYSPDRWFCGLFPV